MNTEPIMKSVITIVANISGPAEREKNSGVMRRIIVKKKDGKNVKIGRNSKNMAMDMAVVMIS